MTENKRHKRKYYCSQCGCENVEHTHWVNVNTNRVGERCNGDNSWCPQCEDHVMIEQKIEVDPSDMPQEVFTEYLENIFSRMKPSEILAIPGVWDLVAEELNNQIIDEWTEDQKSE